MTRLLLVMLLIAACGDGSTDPKAPVRWVLSVQGDQTGTPGPYCVVSMNSPAVLRVVSRPGVTDSAVANLNVGPGRYQYSWELDAYDANGFYVTSLYSSPYDSTDAPGGGLFVC
jgi:hypothetical protein